MAGVLIVREAEGKVTNYEGKEDILEGNAVVAPLSDLNFLLMQEEARLYPDHKVFEQANQGRYAMFDKVCGSSYIRETFARSHRWSDIRDYWYKDAESFRKVSRKYYLYK